MQPVFKIGFVLELFPLFAVVLDDFIRCSLGAYMPYTTCPVELLSA